MTLKAAEITTGRDNSESMQNKRQKIFEIETKLQQEADEMQNLLREKNWYQKYANKIAAEEAEKQKVLASIIQQAQANENLEMQ